MKKESRTFSITELRQPGPEKAQRYVAFTRRPLRAKLPCFLCSADLELRVDKNGKRYFICDECGVQAFIRRKPGISKLAKLVRQFKKAKPKNAADKESPFQFCAIIAEIDELKEQIKKQKSKQGLFSSDPEVKRTIKVLEARVNALLSTLEKHAKIVRPILKTKNIS